MVEQIKQQYAQAEQKLKEVADNPSIDVIELSEEELMAIIGGALNSGITKSSSGASCVCDCRCCSAN